MDGIEKRAVRKFSRHGGAAHHRLLGDVHQIFDVVILVLLKRRKQHVQDLLLVDPRPFPFLLLLPVILQLQGREKRTRGRGR